MAGAIFLLFLFPACLSAAAGGAAPEDWPAWRHDPGRGAATAHRLEPELHLHWRRDLGPPRRAWPDQRDDFEKLAFDVSYEPVAAAGLLFVPSMTADRLTAYRLDDGAEAWRFYTGGPVRFTPAFYGGFLYLVSDDGYLYCLEAASGRERWRFRGGPAAGTTLGNERLISRWPARLGPVVSEGTVYFAAGLWPFEGVFVYALAADSGRLIWRNETAAAHQVSGFFGYRGISPQGYAAVAGDRLVVPNGRATPAVFDRRDGRLLYFRQGRGEVGQAAGGYRVYARGDWFFNESPFAPRRSVSLRQTTHLYHLEDGAMFTIAPLHVLGDEYWFGVDDGRLVAWDARVEDSGAEVENRLRRRALEARFSLREAWRGEPVADLERLHLLAGDTLYGSGSGGRLFALRPPLNAAAGDGAELVRWTGRVSGEVFTMIAARGRLLVVTAEGVLYCFGPGPREPRTYAPPAEPLPPPDEPWLARARAMVGGVEAGGYALLLGAGSGRLAEALLAVSDLRLIIVESDRERVGQLRRRLDGAGLYGWRAAVIEADPARFDCPPYIATLVAAEDLDPFAERGDAFVVDAFLHPLRPWGGRACLPLSGDRDRDFTTPAAVPGLLREDDAAWFVLRRPGPLPGAADWTHELADAGNSRYAPDALVRWPLGVAWFGGSDNRLVLPRHGNAPAPQASGGRLFVMGVDHLFARCLYTGREMWRASLPAVGASFSTTRHQPGALYAGSPVVSMTDGIYVLHDDHCLRLDPASGAVLDRFTMPSSADLAAAAGAVDRPSAAAVLAAAAEGAPETTVRWGNITVFDDLLLAAADPHFFDGGNVGGQNWNATSSEFLVAMDRFSGEVRWVRRAAWAFRHNGVAAGNGRVFVLDNLSSELLERLARRGHEVDVEPRLLAFSAGDGELLWQDDTVVFGTLLAYSPGHDVLVEGGRPNWTGRYASHRLPDEPRNDRLRARRGADGKELWHRADESGLDGPPALHDGLGLVFGGPGAPVLCLLTGEAAAGATYRVSGHGCGAHVAGRHLLAMRAGSAAVHDLDAGESHYLPGFRAGCNESLVPAGGVLNAPDYTRTCTCNYPLQTSLGLVHAPAGTAWR